MHFFVFGFIEYFKNIYFNFFNYTKIYNIYYNNDRIVQIIPTF